MTADQIRHPPIRPAATLVLVRDGLEGPEILLQQRSPTAAFMPGAHVFPGGAVESSDIGPLRLLRVTGLTDAEASARLGIADAGLAYWVAAVRECFEEAGILIGHDSTSACLTPAYVAGLSPERQALNRKQLDFADFLTSRDVFLHALDLAYFDHWITSPIAARRFDTRFFIAIAPPGQTGSSDEREAVNTTWLRPADALDLLGSKQMQIAAATESVLRELAPFGSAGEMFAYARDKRDIETNRPAVAQGSTGQRVFRRDSPAYAEVRWCDPEETMCTTYDLTPGVPKRLDAHVTRVIAPNAGMMTGPGTNTYVVGHHDLVVIDPGPAIDSHIAAILSCAAGRIRWIACTHTHRDHSPAADALRTATGARLIGRPAPTGLKQDESFIPDWVVVHDEVVAIAGLRLRALQTPGHASNHVCYLLEDTSMLFAGDHVMQGSTVVINPPDGNMKAYLSSLEALLLLDIAVIAPGHGYLIGSPRREIRKLLTHRLSRELKILEAVANHPETAAVDLVPIVYADTSPRLHTVATRSLLAHLDKLVEEGRVTESQGRYALFR